MLGFVLRHQLIHEVRREYEGIVESIQSPELLQCLPLPLADETINWPHQNMLCFPLFTIQEGGSCEVCHSDQDTALQSPKHNERDQKADLVQSPPLSTRTSTPNHSSKSLVSRDNPINSPTDSRACQPLNDEHSDEQFAESSLNCLLEPLPRDREALLELRSQLTMELLWIKQAIASRQEVNQSLQTLYTPLFYTIFNFTAVFTAKKTISK